MMERRLKNDRILAISPSARGFGFAVSEGHGNFIDWGGKSAKGDKNSESLAKLEALIMRYKPGIIVVEVPTPRGSGHSSRVQELTHKIATLAESHNLKVKSVTREKVKRSFFPDGQGTKHGIAEIIASRYPEEFGYLLPPKRCVWKNEDHRMDVFGAVALILVFQLKKKRRAGRGLGM